MTTIIGIGGKLESGKSTSANFIAGTLLWQDKICDSYRVTDKGELVLNDVFGVKEAAGKLDLKSRDPEILRFLKEHVFPTVRIISFADPLKQLCSMLGIDINLMYTKEGKRSETHIDWSQMPGKENVAGKMTVREVLQFVGTDIFRNINPNIWVDATMALIKRSNSKFVIIDDLRFPNELKAIKDAEGVTVYMMRKFHELINSTHSSENGIGPQDVDIVIENEGLTIPETNLKLNIELNKYGILPNYVR